MNNKDKEKEFFNDRVAAKRAKALENVLDPDLSLELTDEQRTLLLAYVEKHKRYPSAIELNFKASVDASTMFPVTVLVGAMA
jgi:hypothetical protein